MNRQKQPGKKRVTVKDIAQRLGVSAMTVSRALNDQPRISDETREKVLQTARKMGYRPDRVARGMVLQRTRLIGVVVPELTTSFFPEVFRGIDSVAVDRDYQVIMIHSDEDADRERVAIQTLEGHRVDGFLISAVETIEEFDEYERLESMGTPFIFFNRGVTAFGAQCVSIDDRELARKMTEHLIVDHNYKRIAHLYGSSKLTIGKRRFEGFKQALREHDLPLEETLTIPSGYSEDEGYYSMKILLKHTTDLPEAVFAANDPSAFGAIKAAREKGLRVPEDIAVVGFTDDMQAQFFDPPLTTVHHHAYELGRIATETLLDVIEDPDGEMEMPIVSADLVIRRSCGCGS